jgi:hypothetical protein
MFWTVVYISFAYAAVYLLLRLTRGFSGAPSRYRKPTTLVLLSLPLIPYALVAFQTALFLPSLRPALQAAVASEYGSEVQPSIIRVLRIYPVPVVYAVIPCDDGVTETSRVGLVYRFEQAEEGWRWDRVPDAAWSDCGSAQGNTFPPYPEGRSF